MLGQSLRMVSLSQSAQMTRRTCRYKGHSNDQIGDGTSKTMVFCESREKSVAAWYDSAASWIIGGVGEVNPATGGITGTEGAPSTLEAEHFLNQGDLVTAPTSAAEGYYNGLGIRKWGASSEHAGDVIVHVFADAHTKAISQEVDPYLYLKLITRAGGESVTQP